MMMTENEKNNILSNFLEEHSKLVLFDDFVIPGSKVIPVGTLIHYTGCTKYAFSNMVQYYFNFCIYDYSGNDIVDVTNFVLQPHNLPKLLAKCTAN